MDDWGSPWAEELKLPVAPTLPEIETTHDNFTSLSNPQDKKLVPAIDLFENEGFGDWNDVTSDNEILHESRPLSETLRLSSELSAFSPTEAATVDFEEQKFEFDPAFNLKNAGDSPRTVSDGEEEETKEALDPSFDENGNGEFGDAPSGINREKEKELVEEILTSREENSGGSSAPGLDASVEAITDTKADACDSSAPLSTASCSVSRGASIDLQIPGEVESKSVTRDEEQERSSSTNEDISATSETDDDFGDFEEEQASEVAHVDTAHEESQSPVSPPDHKTRAELPRAVYTGEILSFDVDLGSIEGIFPTSATGTELKLVDADSLSSTSARKAWYRIARPETIRKLNSGEDDYVRVSWTGSSVQAEMKKIVGRWINEDRMVGGVILGGVTKLDALFGWENTSRTPSPGLAGKEQNKRSPASEKRNKRPETGNISTTSNPSSPFQPFPLSPPRQSFASTIPTQSPGQSVPNSPNSISSSKRTSFQLGKQERVSDLATSNLMTPVSPVPIASALSIESPWSTHSPSTYQSPTSRSSHQRGTLSLGSPVPSRPAEDFKIESQEDGKSHQRSISLNATQSSFASATKQTFIKSSADLNEPFDPWAALDRLDTLLQSTTKLPSVTSGVISSSSNQLSSASPWADAPPLLPPPLPPISQQNWSSGSPSISTRSRGISNPIMPVSVSTNAYKGSTATSRTNFNSPVFPSSPLRTVSYTSAPPRPSTASGVPTSSMKGIVQAPIRPPQTLDGDDFDPWAMTESSSFAAPPEVKVQPHVLSSHSRSVSSPVTSPSTTSPNAYQPPLSRSFNRLPEKAKLSNEEEKIAQRIISNLPDLSYMFR